MSSDHDRQVKEWEERAAESDAMHREWCQHVRREATVERAYHSAMAAEAERHLEAMAAILGG